MSEPLPELAILLSAGRGAARAITAAPDVAEAAPDAARLLDVTYALGRTVSLSPEARGATEVRRYLQDTGVDLSEGVAALVYWRITLENRFYGSWEWDWTEACRRRSALEFLLALYQGTPLEESFAELDPVDVDEQLRHWAPLEGYLAPERVPEGIPASHWWWWAPDAPLGSESREQS
jgi:hypothetical protein